LKDGQVSESGTYKELLDKKGDFADFLIQHMQELNEDKVDGIGKYLIVNGSNNNVSNQLKAVNKRFSVLSYHLTNKRY